MAGANGNSKIQFIIIEQEGSGQNRWGPRFSTQSRAQLVFFDATGRETGKFNFPVDPPTGGTLDVLVATEEFAALASAPTPDVLIPPLLNPISGKVCFRANPANIVFARNDCLSYGSFTGDTETNENGIAAGSPAPALPIMGTVSLRRTTNTDRNSDYSLVTPNPHNISGATFTIPVATQVAQGETLFNNEEFLGNGRTCTTCHMSAQNFRLTPAEIQSRFTNVAATFDSLFIAENNPSSFDTGFDFNLNTLLVTGTVPSSSDAPCTGELRGIVTASGGSRARVVTRTAATTYLVDGGRNPLLTGTVTDGTCSATVSSVTAGSLGDIPGSGVAGLENPQRMRTSVSDSFTQGRALILENIDGFTNPPVFRKSPHLLNMSRTAPFGLSGESANAQLFTTGAVQQHFPRTLTRNGGGTNPDFRLPTADELAAIEAFMLAQEFPPGTDADKFNLDRFALTEAQQRGRTAFFGSAKCSQCHGGTVLAATTVSIQEKAVGVNAAFNTGVVNQPINSAGGDNLPCEPSVGVCGTREFSTPQLFNIKNLAPFFHDASVATVQEAVEFYTSAAFSNSPAGLAIGGITMSVGTVGDITAFLEGLVGISAITPAIGHTTGGTAVTLSGTNFVADATVTIGGVTATNVTRVNMTTITATTPAHAAGVVDVVVTNPGEQALTLTDGFTFTTAAAPTVSSIAPVSGPVAGGTAVTITGANFVGGIGLVVYVGLPTTNATVVNATTITATTVAGDTGLVPPFLVDVVVTTPDTQNGSLIEGFTYLAMLGTPFTDDPLTAGTVIKAVHFEELRTRINFQLVRFGQPAHVFSNSITAGVSTIKALDLLELYTAVNNALAAASQSSIAAPTITPEVTSAITSHITNVRDAVSTLEAL